MQHQIIANRVNYETSVLNMDLVAKSSEALQTLVTQLNQQGFKAELGNIQTQGATVVGLVKIQ
jgi:general secretion pathway protein L